MDTADRKDPLERLAAKGDAEAKWKLERRNADRREVGRMVDRLREQRIQQDILTHKDT